MANKKITLKLKTKLLIIAILLHAIILPAQADKKQAKTIPKKASKAEEKTDTAIKITTKGKLKFSSQDGAWSFQPIGRIMWDVIATDGYEADFNGTELRRARLGFQGNIYDWGYKLEADFAKGDASIKDAYLNYSTNFGAIKAGFKLGQAHIPFGLNTKISSKYMSFIDRPWFADSTISPARRSGTVASLMASNYRWLLATSLTNGELNKGKTEDNSNTFAIRGSLVPFMQDKTHLLQIGVGYLNQGSDDDKFTFEQRLASHKDKDKLLKTTSDTHAGSEAFTVDALAIFGSFHAMTEYIDYTIKNKEPSNIAINGFAVEASYFLTGESTQWKKGYTSSIKPKTKYGAWQIATRFESLKLDEQNKRDEANKFTFGINYYPTQNIRLMLNYDQITALTVDGENKSKPSSLKFRAQAYW